MRFCVLASGSKANSTFVEAGGKRLLIDCGLSARQVEQRLIDCEIEPSSIDAILVTHEHTDHIRGINLFSRKHKIRVYASRGTARKLPKVYALERFDAGGMFELGGLEVHPFSITHDAEEPVGYSLFGDGLKFSQVTDVGKITPLIRAALALSDAMVIEFNHDLEMLWGCRYPWLLKQRIASAHGHCSNEDAAHLVRELYHPGLQYLVLGHISENSNTHGLARSALVNALEGLDLPRILCATPYNRTELFELGQVYNLAAIAS